MKQLTNIQNEVEKMAAAKIGQVMIFELYTHIQVCHEIILICCIEFISSSFWIDEFCDSIPELSDRIQ